MLAAGIILAIMIIPIITSISREILRSVPGLQREAAYALGATRWEVTRIAVLSYAKKGIVRRGHSRPGPRAGRDDGRDDGHRQHTAIRRIPLCARLHAGQRDRQSNSPRPSAICIYSSLFELGLVLLGVTMLVNIFAQLLLKTFAGPSVKPQH